MTTRIMTCPVCGLDLEILPTADDVACPSCGHGHWYRVERVGDVEIVHLKGEGLITEQNIMRVLERVRTLINDRGWDRILLNFEGVTYVSSTILAHLVNLARMSSQHHAHLKLCGLRPDVQDIFRITRLEAYFDMYSTQDEAISAFISGHLCQ